ncbi:MAG TPA: serine hydrolase domain-containing protein [Abditibacteriaceae bacterium]|jgi:CubicO group peptidase (beta-lactamase class C family)
MNFKRCLILLTFVAGFLNSANLCHAAPASLPASLDEFLETHRAKAALPGVAAAVVKDGEVFIAGVAGVRKQGAPEKATLQDKWHIGSCTKAMTATLAAQLIEKGTLRWKTTLAEAFPKLKLKKAWQDVTIEQLLSHRAGAPGDLNAQGLWGRIWQRAELPPRQQRAYLATELLTKHEPIHAPGTKYEYSNAGYALVGHLIEEKLNQPFENILRAQIFEPLQMNSAGFGAPATKENPQEPWAHVLKNGKPQPVPPGLGDDNPAAIGPGGTVHCSISDLARFAAFHLKGEREGFDWLSQKSFQKLHTPPAKDNEYAMGWIALQRGWGDGTVLMHNGSNTMNYSVMWLAPRRNFAVVICTNVAGEGVDGAIDEIAWQLIQKYNARS